MLCYNEINEAFGRRVEKERKRQGLSRDKLAGKADVSIDIIKRIEHGKGAKLADAYNIAAALSIPIRYLLPPQRKDRNKLIKEIRLMLDELENYTPQ